MTSMDDSVRSMNSICSFRGSDFVIIEPRKSNVPKKTAGAGVLGFFLQHKKAHF